MMVRYWIGLYDRDDRLITRYRIWENAEIRTILESAALSYRNIEYVKITVNPPDESKADETS
jgi:hypothetical protein